MTASPFSHAERSGPPGPLTGVRVLDLSASTSPVRTSCTLLADQGAQVVKIEPPDGDNLQAVGVSGNQCQAQALKRAANFVRREREPEQLRAALVGKPHGSVRRGQRPCDNSLASFATRDLENQLRGASRRGQHTLRVHAALEAVAGVAVQREITRRLADARCLENRRLEQNVGGRQRVTPGILAAHHTTKRESACAVGDHELARNQRVLTSIEREELLARVRGVAQRSRRKPSPRRTRAGAAPFRASRNSSRRRCC